MNLAKMVIKSGRHIYWSTACLHGEHAYCSSDTGTNGETTWVKAPGRCKFCRAQCTCHCHAEGT
jgi:hypothetical protein